jgi:hypothetical protein
MTESPWVYGQFNYDLYIRSLTAPTTDVPTPTPTPTLMSTTAPSVARFIPYTLRYPLWPGMNTTIPNKDSSNGNNNNNISVPYEAYKWIVLLVVLAGFALIIYSLYKILVALKARRLQSQSFGMVPLNEI